MTQLGRLNLIEGWLADLFAKELIKKKLTNPKKDLENLAVDEELDVVGKKKNQEWNFINYRFRNNIKKRWDKKYYKSD